VADQTPQKHTVKLHILEYIVLPSPFAGSNLCYAFSPCKTCLPCLLSTILRPMVKGSAKVADQFIGLVSNHKLGGRHVSSGGPRYSNMLPVEIASLVQLGSPQFVTLTTMDLAQKRK
jgi:hypothetical protein